MASHPPSVSQTAFDCPFCGAYTTQAWRSLYSTLLTDDDGRPKTPGFWTEDARASISRQSNVPEEDKATLLAEIDRNLSGKVHVEHTAKSPYVREVADNLFLSTCYNCREHSVWVHRRLMFPAVKAGDPPNADLDDDIKRDFDEARGITNASPRGAAALARLAIQKLCKQLGEPGRNINDDIASLVKKGLDPRLQMALDVVRVVGNEAVHPGEIDIRDDPDTATQLLSLVNEIADEMLSRPKRVQALYSKLPPSKVAAIAQRDAPKTAAAPAPPAASPPGAKT
jgi:hypothetical protein